MLTPERTRVLLLGVWSRQACRLAADWPDVLARLTESSSRHGSFEPRVAEAVERLTAAFQAGIPPDAAHLIWRAFPMLDPGHCRELAMLLEREVTGSGERAA